MTGRRLMVTVSDDGVAFNPLAVPPPDTTLPLEERELGGLGIHLVRNLTDEATYGRLGGRNVITDDHGRERSFSATLASFPCGLKYVRTAPVVVSVTVIKYSTSESAP